LKNNDAQIKMAHKIILILGCI